ncbi:MAG TPA: ABC transporter permease [Blastocatellia bacterium]|nr:ABC transporter permease [Blastocatellia bacterium]
MASIIHDLKLGFGALLKRPAFATVVVLALAIGIGGNTAIFSVANALLIRPLPYENADDLVWIRETNARSGVMDETVSPTNFLDWKDRNESFADMAAVTGGFATVTTNGEPERLFVSFVTANYFSVLGVRTRIGRTFEAGEAAPGKNQVVVLSAGFWEREFGSNPDVLGTTVTLNGSPYTIIGVLPSGFLNARPDYKPPEMWMATILNYNNSARRRDYLSVIARLKPEISIERARADMKRIEDALAQQFPDTNEGWSTTIIPLGEVFFGDIRPAINALALAVCFLLLIACANVSNLLLARGTARQKEIAIRVALGARRARIVQQLMCESIVLALLGGGLGVLLSYFGLKLLVRFGPDSIPRFQEIGIDPRVLGFTLGISILSAILFGLVPAVQASREDLSSALKTTKGHTSARLRNKALPYTIATAEVALSFVLLVGAGLLVKSFLRLQNVNLGFKPDRTLMAMLALPPSSYRDPSQVAAFYRELLNRVGELPGVQAVAVTSDPPLVGGNAILSFELPEQVQFSSDRKPDADFHTISPTYFEAIGCSLLSGRGFSDSDTEQAQRVVVVNRSLAERYWPHEEPLGRRVSIPGFGKESWQIIGVVDDIRNDSLVAAPYPQMYASYAQIPTRSMFLIARATNDPISLLPAVRAIVRDMDKDQPLSNISTMDDWVAHGIARPRFNTALMLLFASIAFGLAALGIYAVISFFAVQRTHEIGIRMALGASQRNILWLIVRQGMILALMGVPIGLFGSLVLTRFLSSLLFGVVPTDSLTFAGGSILVVLLALISSYIPALRASRVDAAVSLRAE